MGAKSITRRAYAKINLALSVGPPVPPPSPRAGFHPIASWMACIDLFDELTVTRLRDGEPSRCTISWAADAPRPSAIDWPIEKDLAVRAHRALEADAGRELPVEMRLIKRTPVGGGLGGGSSDGAAALLAVRGLFDLPLNSARLAELSGVLGSDAAFFIDDGPVARPALVSGLGSRIERVSAPGLSVLLVVPPFGCPTGPVYKALDQQGSRGLREDLVRSLVENARRGRLRSEDLFNDLAAPACAVEPRLEQVLDACRRACGLPVHMTGSGSTLFIVGDGAQTGLDDAASAISAAVPGVATVGTRLV